MLPSCAPNSWSTSPSPAPVPEQPCVRGVRRRAQPVAGRRPQEETVQQRPRQGHQGFQSQGSEGFKVSRCVDKQNSERREVRES